MQSQLLADNSRHSTARHMDFFDSWLISCTAVNYHLTARIGVFFFSFLFSLSLSFLPEIYSINEFARWHHLASKHHVLMSTYWRDWKGWRLVLAPRDTSLLATSKKKKTTKIGICSCFSMRPSIRLLQKQLAQHSKPVPASAEMNRKCRVEAAQKRWEIYGGEWCCCISSELEMRMKTISNRIRILIFLMVLAIRKWSLTRW